MPAMIKWTNDTRKLSELIPCCNGGIISGENKGFAKTLQPYRIQFTPHADFVFGETSESHGVFSFRGLAMKKLFKCHNCKKEILRYPSQVGDRVFCNRKCYVESRLYSGANNPRWAGGSVERICPECGDTYYVKRSQIKRGRGKHCSRKCQRNSRSILKTCEICATEFKLKKSHDVNGQGRYCSLVCRSAGYTKRGVFRGKNNPRYIDGKSQTKEYVCRASQIRRVKIAENGGNYTLAQWEYLCKQYDYRCLACGKKKNLTVDHVVPVSLGGSNDISNIQPLCMSCNASKSAKHIDYRPNVDHERWIQKRLVGD